MVARRNVRSQEWLASSNSRSLPLGQSMAHQRLCACARAYLLILVIGAASLARYLINTSQLADDWLVASHRAASRWIIWAHEDVPRCAGLKLIRPAGVVNGTWAPRPYLAQEPSLQRYLGLNGRHPAVPTWIVTPGNISSTIRFYDTSPFSPSGKYLALLRFPRGSEGKPVYVLEEAGSALLPAAEVVLVNLWTGVEMVVAKTYGWDSQTGAHVQWGASDDDLFYNDVVWDAGVENYRAVGVRMNSFRRIKKHLDCPVYQVRALALDELCDSLLLTFFPFPSNFTQVSPDGQWAISPCLRRISRTQRGYGVHVPGIPLPENTDASDADGLYLTSTVSGEVR